MSTSTVSAGSARGKGVAAARAATQARATRTPIAARSTTKTPALSGAATKRVATKTSATARDAIVGHRKRLTVVAAPAPERLSTARFAAFVFALVLFGLGASLALNTALGSGAFELATLQQRHADLMDAQQAAAQRLATLETPAVLAKRAHTLGMVAATGPAFLSLANGSVVGAGIKNPVAKGAPVVVRPVVPVTRALIPIKVVPKPAFLTAPAGVREAALAALATTAAFGETQSVLTSATQSRAVAAGGR